MGIKEASGTNTTPFPPSVVSILVTLFLTSFDSLCLVHSLLSVEFFWLTIMLIIII